MKKCFRYDCGSYDNMYVGICICVTKFKRIYKNNDSKSTPVTYEYAPDQLGETVRSIKPLMTKLDDLSKQSSVVQTLTISKRKCRG